MNLVWSPLYEYNGSNANVYAPLSAGVYRLSCDRDDKRPVFYVGQAENLWERLRYHLSDEETSGCIVRHRRRCTCYFRFAKVEKQEDRDGAERALYDHFNPACNEVAPPGPAADINFE